MSAPLRPPRAGTFRVAVAVGGPGAPTDAHFTTRGSSNASPSQVSHVVTCPPCPPWPLWPLPSRCASLAASPARVRRRARRRRWRARWLDFPGRATRSESPPRARFEPESDAPTPVRLFIAGSLRCQGQVRQGAPRRRRRGGHRARHRGFRQAQAEAQVRQEERHRAGRRHRRRQRVHRQSGASRSSLPDVPTRILSRGRRSSFARIAASRRATPFRRFSHISPPPARSRVERVGGARDARGGSATRVAPRAP